MNYFTERAPSLDYYILWDLVSRNYCVCALSTHDMWNMVLVLHGVVVFSSVVILFPNANSPRVSFLNLA